MREACNRKAGDSGEIQSSHHMTQVGTAGTPRPNLCQAGGGGVLLALTEMWMIRFPIEYRGNTKALDRIYKMVGEGISCFLGKSVLFLKKEC